MTQAIIIYNASQEFVNDAAFTDAMWHRASDVKYAISSKYCFVSLTRVPRLHRKVLDEIMEWVKNYKVCNPRPIVRSLRLSIYQERTTMQKIRHSFDDEVGEIVRLKGKLGQALLTFGVSCMFSILY